MIFLCLLLPACLPAAAAFAAVWLTTLAAAAFAACRNGSPEINLSLALIAVALPVAGPLTLLVVSRKKRKRGVLKAQNVSFCNGWERAALEICGTGGAGYDRAEYFSDGASYLTCLFQEIERAKKRVCLEYYILAGGKIFSRLTDALRKAKENGSEIFIIVDGVGCAFRLGRKERKRLKDLGATLKIFHRLTPFPCFGLNFRDHRKIAVIDGKAAFTGGVNLADEYANLVYPFGYWKDTGVALYGAAAKVFEEMFFALLRGSGTVPPCDRGTFRCLPYYDTPHLSTGFYENACAAAIASAKKRVHIFTPYFCVGEKIASALTFAAARGVDVRILLPHIPDKKCTFELSKTFALPLAEKGVKFYEYTPGFLHAKSLICDDSLFIGSHNFDFRSMRLNCECGVMLSGQAAERAERDFWESLRLSAPLSRERVRPLRRTLRFFLKLFAPLA